MVLQCADAGQQNPLGRRQRGGVFSSPFDKAHSAGCGGSSSLAGLSVEEAFAGIWALEGADGVLDGGGSLPPVATVVCQGADGGSPENRRHQPHLQQWRSHGGDRGQPASGPAAPENGTKWGLVPCSLPTTHPLDQRPLYQQHPQNYSCGDVMATYPLSNEQLRYEGGSGNGGSNVAISYCSAAALGFGGVGQTAAVSPKSSISSDGSGGDMVVRSPSAVWEVEMHRGAPKGGGGAGDGGGSGGGARKRAPEPTNELAIEPWQPQMVSTASDSPANFHDTNQSIDAIEQLFHCANMELESCLTVDEAEVRNREEKVKQLLQLLRVTSMERDEARGQLQRLLSKIQAAPLDQSPHRLHHTYPQPVSSPMHALAGAVSPPELPHKVMAVPSFTTPARLNAPPLHAGPMPPAAAAIDPATAIIDRLVQRRALPEKGKLLQAVMEAGPLLQTLLVAGSLPRWRNPPPLQPFQVPPVAVRGRESGVLGQNAASSRSYLLQSSSGLFHNRNPPVASQIYSASPLGTSGTGSFALRTATPATCAVDYQCPARKRRKF